ncbi:MAG: FHA domain-containing protein [Firmicutes bacterium]|nr:FHA domain-containing protein [Bacillota bacterium]
MVDTQTQSRFQMIRFKERVAGTFIGTGNQINLIGKKLSIGRSARCDIIINDGAVEERHCSLLIEEDRVTVVDLDSASGSYVNSHRIAGRHSLRHMDQIQIGGSKFLFIDRTYPLDAALLEDFYDDSLPEVNTDLEYTSKQETMIGLGKTRISPDLYNTWGNEIIQILQDIVTGYSLPNLLERILEFLFHQFPADRGFILLLDQDSQQLAPVATRSRVSGERKGRLAISKTLLKRVWKEREAVLICDMGGLNTMEKTASMLFHGFTSILVAPLIYNDQFLGILQIDTIDQARQLSEDDLTRMQAYCQVAALAIGNARMREKLQEEEHTRIALSRYLPRKLIEQVVSGESLIPPEGTHWEVAILFADIRGFSKMSGRLSSRDIIEVLNEYYNEVSDSIFEYSGMINQFVGDEIMAIFGGPWITEKDYNPADAAVQAAREVIRQICRMNVERNEQGKETIFVGIGLDFGKVLIGNLGSSKKFEFTAVGNTVVIANRLCSAAKESQILVTDRVKEKLSRNFTMEKMEPVIGKNVKDPIETFRVYWNR